jgi:hypothetical protein|tara:strand:- start:321 stop:1853 length:1533 start_codon:yes stop_codon:yes gene_type:complete
MQRCQYDAVSRGRNRDATIPLETRSNLVLDVPMTRALALFLIALLLPATALTRPRLLVLTDISNEPDDEQSMVRLLCYANELEIEGLIATTSCWLRNRTAPGKIVERIEAYRQVRKNLTVHAGGWPEADELLKTVKEGIPRFGMEGVGEGHDSTGSEHIIRVVDENDTRPVYVSVWGGANCLAQALWKVSKTRPRAEADRFISKLRVYTISDQDDAGPWMRNRFPGLFYIVSPGHEEGQGGSYHYATWVGISGDRFHGRFRGPDFSLVDNPWLDQHIRNNHGPLGAMHPHTKYLMEGDTPSFFWVIPNGLNEPEHPDWGGWGGRYELYTAPPKRYYHEPETRPIWTNAMDEVKGVDGKWHTSNHATIWRWRREYQHDFAARIDWSNSSEFETANHPPLAIVNGDRTREAIHLTVAPGNKVTLDASKTSDPDGDKIAFRWHPYREVGSFPLTIHFRNLTWQGDDTAVLTINAPRVKAPRTIHFILEATDGGAPPLTSYRRVIITIDPDQGN